uniref:hypothetical protein n=1 Tax=Agathobacter sp. TaxID=2021311 RepID=UPI0040578560
MPIDDGMIADITKQMEIYDKIFLVEKNTENIFIQFLNSDILNASEKKILLISPEEMDISPAVDFHRVTESQFKGLKSLYYMYEFSNRFQILAGSSQWGNLLNYLDTGILDTEEVFQALLY